MKFRKKSPGHVEAIGKLGLWEIKTKEVEGEIKEVLSLNGEPLMYDKHTLDLIVLAQDTDSDDSARQRFAP